MNTPAHIAINLTLLGRAGHPERLLPAVIGSLLPDLPMMVFYLVQKLQQVEESVIWRDRYFDADWQLFFNIFNSAPLAGAGLALAVWRRSQSAMVFFGAVLLHIAGDLPLHREDAHAHFWPLTDWLFISPVSYWDPSHHGNVFLVFEAITVIACCLLLFRRFEQPKWRRLFVGVAAIYVLYGVYVAVVWL